jgi:hypothetical protein
MYRGFWQAVAIRGGNQPTLSLCALPVGQQLAILACLLVFQYFLIICSEILSGDRDDLPQVWS